MFQRILATAHLVGLRLAESTRRRAESERGSYTVELVVVLAAIVLIAVAVTAIIQTGVLEQVNEIF
ncbi:hypothetical protein GCM10009718_27910 [Isoptericola halotolerans]|uniref:Flp family type IVb pilin n=1 Tax=Isoptericola halotolerans TaxID=300560 RepID=A0ABX2A3X6_9MICO|nr:hypothetical protein [Isoptericola halotolerans]NOV97359.1 hypothetical protein [Isoptericola halotolerans]